jgi:hypothetical protein
MTANVIYKYRLETTDDQQIVLPVGARILCVQTQDEIPCLWVQQDEDRHEKERHHIRIYGTGHWMAMDPGVYIGTYQLRNGGLVFHVYQQSVSPV